MRKISTLLMLFCAFVGTAFAQEIRGVKEVPTTAVDFSSETLTTGYYLIKQTNTEDWQGYLKAASEAADAVVTPTETAPTPNAENEATYIWYVEVSDGKFSVATANKKAAWQAPTQKQKNLVAYADKATTLELETTFGSLNGTTQTLVKAYWEAQSCYSYVHASSHNLGSWNDQNTKSLFYLEFYRIAESNLVIVDEMAVLKSPLVDLVAELSSDFNLGSVALQTADANAPFYLSATVQGDAPISKAIDNDPSTYYGSTWGSTVGHHHYWQVDLADAASLSEFKFSYITRANGKDAPTKINVQGSNDGEAFTDIVVLTEGLPSTGGATYNSATITNNGYRYLRFEVPSTTTNFSAAGNAEQEVTIAVAEFRLKSTDVEDYSAKDKAIWNAIVAAQEVIDNPSATEEDINTAFANLKMASIEKPSYPFTVTTNDAEPVVYALKSGRGDAYWYTYDSSDGKIALSAYTAAQTQLWYFKEVVTSDYKYALQLFPYTGEGKAMSYENTDNGKSKVVAKDLNTTGWTNYWLLVAGSNGKYGLQTYNKANYLSNNGGTANKMGMWNAGPDSDDGTAIYFIDPAEAVNDLVAQAEEMLTNAGTKIGNYTAATITNISAAVNTAKDCVATKNYAEAVAALNTAIAAAEIILPTPGKVYAIKSASTNAYCAGKYVHANTTSILRHDTTWGDKVYDHRHLVFDDIVDVDPTALWMFTEDMELKNVHTGEYVKSFNNGAEHMGTEGDAQTITIGALGEAQVYLKIGGNNPMHAQEAYGAIVAWAAEKNNASAWYIEEVEEFSHVATITGAGYATLVLGFNAVIPNEVEAYAVTEAGDGVAEMTKVTGVLPANQAVILKGAEGDYEFAYTEGTAVVEGNLLKGTLFDSNVAAEAYVLGNNGGVGLFKAILNQAEGTAFLNNANKAYLLASDVENTPQGTLRFNFGGTTAIESVLNNGIDANAAIYDLSGRRVEKAVKGIYIQNGKKIIVK